MQPITEFDSLLRACQNSDLKTVVNLMQKGADPHAQNSSGKSVIDIFTGLTEGSAEEKLNNALFTNANEGNAERVKLLLALGGNVNQVYSSGFTLLHIASFKGHLEMVKTLIEAGPNLDAKSLDGATPLHYACQNGHLEIVNTLIKAEANLDAKTLKNFTSLLVASGNGHLEIVNALIKAGANLGAESGISSPLHYTCQNGHLEVVKALIEAGANLKAEAEYKFTPLHVACQNGHLEVVQALIEAGADSKAKSTMEYTPLHLACEFGHLEMVKTLINAGADPCARNINGHSPIDVVLSKENERFPAEPQTLNNALLINSFRGNVEKVQLLLSLGAEVNYVRSADSKKSTPLHLACERGHLEVVKTLIEAGANPHAQNILGESAIDIVTRSDEETSEKKLNYALIISSMNGDVGKIKLLLALGADVNYFDPDLQVGREQVTPLGMASGSNNLEAVRALIDAGADVNKSTSNGICPLHMACEEGHLEVVKTLIDAGADVNKSTSNGICPLHMACEEGHLEVVKTLIEAGANPHAQNSLGKSVIDIVAESLIHQDLHREPSEKKLNYALIINSMNGNVGKIKLLLSLGADVNYFDPDFQVGQITPLGMASGSNNLEAVRALIDAGADVNKSTSNGICPLHIACAEGHLEVIKELIKARANPHARNSSGESAIDIVTANEQIEGGEDRLKASLIINSNEGNAEKVKLLLALGGDVKQVDSSGFTLLHIASSKGHLEVVKALIEAGSEISPQNENQKAVKFYVINPSPEGSLTKPLFAVSPFASEPLHLACQNGHLEVVKTLIEAGAVTQNKDNNGNYPLDIAIKNRNSEIASFLTSSYMERGIASPAVSPSIGNRSELSQSPSRVEGEGQGGGRN